MTGIVLALAGLTCGDSGAGPRAAGEPLTTSPMAFRFHGRWDVVVRGDFFKYRLSADHNTGDILVTARGTGRKLIEFRVHPNTCVEMRYRPAFVSVRKEHSPPDGPFVVRVSLRNGQEILTLTREAARPDRAGSPGR